MSSDTSVHCIVVTPERTELDAQCESLKLPMYDGELGILPGRAPMVGRIGFGLLKLQSATGEQSWFVEGGFVQVTRDGVYVLTNRLLKPEQIDRKSAEEELQKATEMVANTPQTRSVKERALAQARGKLRISS
ncbi:MAG: ATP synthase F1 subunit epsilon [Pirellula sp.]|jgi:F-type H+-transporting ATPase subunit epsilon|nr:ATP synthase F1 subunit epsilon [Pirellula sp.]